MSASEEFRIEPAIAIPPDVKPAGKFPFHLMRIGDSFFVASATRQPSLVRDAARSFTKKNKGWFFVCRPMRDSADRTGTRVWRVAEDIAKAESNASPDGPSTANPMQRPPATTGK